MYEVRLMKSSASEPGLSFCFYLKEGVIFRVGLKIVYQYSFVSTLNRVKV